MAEQEMTATDVRRLLRDKYPPKELAPGEMPPREDVITAIVIAEAENIEVLERAFVQMADKLDAAEKAASAMGRVLAAVAKAAGVDIVAALKAAGVTTGGEKPQAAVQEEEASGPRDSTPFPAGVATSAPPGAPPKVTVQAAESDEEDLTPNVQASQPVNAAPIPAAPNGAKA
jgi:hypothetical protein